jgi:hypothetical protein
VSPIAEVNFVLPVILDKQMSGRGKGGLGLGNTSHTPRKYVPYREQVIELEKKRRKLEHNAERKRFTTDSQSGFCDLLIICHGENVEQNNLMSMLNSKIIPFGEYNQYISFAALKELFEMESPIVVRDTSKLDEYDNFQDGEVLDLDREKAEQYLKDLMQQYKNVIWCFSGKTDEIQLDYNCEEPLCCYEWTGIGHETQRLAFFFAPHAKYEDSFYVGLQIGPLNLVLGCVCGHPFISTNFFEYGCSDGSSRGYKITDTVPNPVLIGEIISSKFWEYVDEYQ